MWRRRTREREENKRYHIHMFSTFLKTKRESCCLLRFYIEVCGYIVEGVMRGTCVEVRFVLCTMRWAGYRGFPRER